MYTTHGHQIKGTPVEEPKPSEVARCGGPGMCSQCSVESLHWAGVATTSPNALDTPEDETAFDKARRLTYRYVKDNLEKTDTHVTFGPDEVYVVWFAFVLGNWKVLLSTTLPDGMYYEVTHNKAAGETYLDAYKKFQNISYPD